MDKQKQTKAYLLEREALINNIDTLIEDIIKLSKKRIIISDVIPINSLCIYKKIYILDFDLYSFADESLKEDQILKINLYKLELYFKRLWMLALVELGVDRRIIKYHPEYFEENHIETVKEKMYDGENIKEYIKRRGI